MSFIDSLQRPESAAQRRRGPVEEFLKEAATHLRKGTLSNLLDLALHVQEDLSAPNPVLERGDCLRLHDGLAGLLNRPLYPAPSSGPVDGAHDDILTLYKATLLVYNRNFDKLLGAAVRDDCFEIIGTWAEAMNGAEPVETDALRRLDLLFELHGRLFGRKNEVVECFREQVLEAERAQRCLKNALLDGRTVSSEGWAKVLLALFAARRALERTATGTTLAQQLAQETGQDPILIEELILHWAATVPVVERLLEQDSGARLFEPPTVAPVGELGSPYGPTHYLMVAGPPKAGKSSLTFSLEDSRLVDVFPINPTRSPSTDTSPAPADLNPLRVKTFSNGATRSPDGASDPPDGSTDQKDVNIERGRWQKGQGATQDPVVMARGIGGGAASADKLNLFVEDVPGSFYSKADRSRHWANWIANRKPTAVALLIPGIDEVRGEPYQRVVTDILKRHDGIPIFLLINRLDQQIQRYMDEQVERDPAEAVDPDLSESVQKLGSRPLRVGVDADGGLAITDLREAAGSLAVLAVVRRQLRALSQELPAIKKHPISLHFICCRYAHSEGLRKESTRVFWNQAYAWIDQATMKSRTEWLERRLIRPIKEHFATRARQQVDQIERAYGQCLRELEKLTDEGWDEGEQAIAARNDGLDVINDLSNQLEAVVEERCSAARTALEGLRDRLEALLSQLIAQAEIPSELAMNHYPSRTLREFIDHKLADRGSEKYIAQHAASRTAYHYHYGTLKTGIPFIDDPDAPEWQNGDALRDQLFREMDSGSFFKCRLGLQALGSEPSPRHWLGLELLRTDVPRFIAHTGTARATIVELFDAACRPLVVLHQAVSNDLNAVEEFTKVLPSRLAKKVKSAWAINEESISKALNRLSEVEGFVRPWEKNEKRQEAAERVRQAVGAVQRVDTLVESAEGRGYLKAVLEAARAVAGVRDAEPGDEPEHLLSTGNERSAMLKIPSLIEELREHHLAWLRRFVTATGWVADTADNQALLTPDPNLPPTDEPDRDAFLDAANGIVQRLKARGT